jgi:acyl-CoA synthetase (AMP-forming)/AMP-acid ligase II
LSRQLADSRAKYLLTTAAFLDKATEAARENNIADVFVIGDSFDALQSDGAVPHVDIDPANDIVAMPYSSGTTGMPKRCPRIATSSRTSRMRASSVHIRCRTAVLSLHIYGMNVIMNLGLHLGITIVTMPKFDLRECLQAIEKYRISYGYIVPPIMLAFAKSPMLDEFDLSSIRILFSGAAPLGESVASQAAQRLRCKIMQGYGMTEASPATHGTRPRSVSIGETPPTPSRKSSTSRLARSSNRTRRRNRARR